MRASSSRAGHGAMCCARECLACEGMPGACEAQWSSTVPGERVFRVTVHQVQLSLSQSFHCSHLRQASVWGPECSDRGRPMTRGEEKVALRIRQRSVGVSVAPRQVSPTGQQVARVTTRTHLRWPSQTLPRTPKQWTSLVYSVTERTVTIFKKLTTVTVTLVVLIIW